jgi:hypothetical protein
MILLINRLFAQFLRYTQKIISYNYGIYSGGQAEDC